MSFAAEREELILSFDYCIEIIQLRLEEIMKKLKCSKYEFYLTGDGNFRHDIAKQAPYKGNRKQPRPYHYKNVTEYLKFKYNATVVDGMEADDMLAIRQTELGDKSVIVSRDKDLRMVKGWHYGYAMSNQPEKDLEYIDEIGYLIKHKSKLIGGGLKWFYAQCIMGDKTDNILGIPKAGPIAAFKALNELTTEEEMKDATLQLYKNYFGEQAEEAFIENARLVWMVTSLDGEGKPVMWNL